jgi:pimeloyl-ACP methyl ester carboxylesterase
VLRSDDRGVGGSEAGKPGDTSADFVTDVLTAFAFLESRADIDAARIGLIGHSEGGLIAALAAAESTEIAYVVMLAGPGITGEEILYLQAEFLLRENGASDQMIAGDRALRARIFGAMKEESEIPIETRLAGLRSEFVARMTSAGMPETAAGAQVDALIEAYSTPWFQWFITYNPALAISRVQSPVLTLIGERDMQVPASANLPAIEAALEAGGNEDYTVSELPELNHLFQTSETGSPSEYAAIEETFDPDALKLIADWIEAHVARP